MTTTVEQRMSDNRVTGHHAWDRVCDHPNGQTQPTDRNRNARRASRVESSSRAVEQNADIAESSEVKTSGPERGAERSRIKKSGVWSRTVEQK